MSRKNECKIVQDLLPNYVEGLTNEETNLFIEEHLRECNTCEKIFNNMKAEIQKPDKEVNKNEEQKYIESLVTLGKKIALEASQDKELENKIKKNSSY